MRVTRLVLSFVLPALVLLPCAAQQLAVPDPQAAALLQKSLSALSGAQSLSDVTLTGTARRIAGSDDDTGTAVFKALSSGAGRVDLSLSSGQLSEVQNLTPTVPTGVWSGPDRVSHPIAKHNVLAEPAWFFPALAIARRLSTSGYVATYIGHETHNGQAVEHVSVSQISPFRAPLVGVSFEHLTQVDFFLDASTLLPEAISFNIHPDNNELLDIPIEVRFSDYRPVNGAQVPFHVQKFMNNSLILDFQTQSVILNTGLSASDFTI